VQDWARKNDRSEIASHLVQLYQFDGCLEGDSEKKLEAVMYHYEALLRHVQAGRSFRLSKYFCFDQTRRFAKVPNFVTAPVKNAGGILSFVQNFDDTDEILKLLKAGCIVVSEFHSEVGTEYLVPYWENNNEETFWVAFVQCKFVKKRIANWTEVNRKLDSSMEPFISRGIKTFKVVYTTADQNTISSTDGGFYFTELDLFNFTSKLGILRLHTEKLGSILAEKYPILKRAISGL